MLPSTLGPIFCGEEKVSWELHTIVKSWVEPTDKKVKQIACPILEWLILICMKGINKETSAKETDISVVTLPSQKLKSWQKMRLERKIGKWIEAHMVSAS